MVFLETCQAQTKFFWVNFIIKTRVYKKLMTMRDIVGL